MNGSSPLFRQWQLLRAIAAGRGEATIKSLSAATGMSDKTIRRDVALLKSVGFPLEERAGEFGRKTYGVEVSGVPQLEFAYDEALALYLCRRGAVGFEGTFVAEAVGAAFKKIEISLGRRAARYVETMLNRIVHTQLGTDYSGQAELLDRLFIAIEEDRAVFLTYRSQRSTEPVTYDVYPYRLIDHRGALYLFGHSPDHGESRTWKVDRMLDAQPTEVRFQRPTDAVIGAQLSGSFGIFSGRGDIKVRIRFAVSAARYVNERKMHASQTVIMQPDGTATVEFRLSNTTEIRAWALSFGAAAEVLEPEELRAEILREIEAQSLIYSASLRSRAPSRKQKRSKPRSTPR